MRKLVIATAFCALLTGCGTSEPDPAPRVVPTPRPTPRAGAACSSCLSDRDCDFGLKCYRFNSGATRCASGVGATC